MTGFLKTSCQTVPDARYGRLHRSRSYKAVRTPVRCGRLVSEGENLEVQLAGERTSERAATRTDTTMGITERRLPTVTRNLRESTRTGFLVGTGLRD
jgi:hypothetical protein